ncbi:hypothetical protein ACWCPQ_11320 [Nocardia sp. NPDC001965]
MGSAYTTREVVDRLVELGLVDASTPGEVFESDELDRPLSDFGHTDQDGVRTLLSELGIRYSFSYKAFRGIQDVDDEARLFWYRRQLESVVECARGSVTIAEVRLVEIDEGDWRLRFDWNGKTEQWPVYPGAEDEDFEARLVFATYLHGMGAPPAGIFCSVDPIDEDSSGEAVFGDPEVLNRFGEPFGLTFGEC